MPSVRVRPAFGRDASCGGQVRKSRRDGQGVACVGARKYRPPRSHISSLADGPWTLSDGRTDERYHSNTETDLGGRTDPALGNTGSPCHWHSPVSASTGCPGVAVCSPQRPSPHLCWSSRGSWPYRHRWLIWVFLDSARWRTQCCFSRRVEVRLWWRAHWPWTLWP